MKKVEVVNETDEQEGQKGLEILDKLYDAAIKGLPASKAADELAMDYLSRHNNNADKAADDLIVNQIAKCSATGFLTGLGGIITLPITIPADVGSCLYVQIRMIAAIAVMGGYNPHDDAVKTMVYTTLLGIELGNILKQVGVATANKLAVSALKKLPGKVLVKVNQKLGFRFITKFGQKGVINLVKAVPFVGGVVNSAFDGTETKLIANRAVKNFIHNDVL
ncbi:MAG: EcsC family protein [Oscillospiraceae bacterium]